MCVGESDSLLLEVASASGAVTSSSPGGGGEGEGAVLSSSETTGSSISPPYGLIDTEIGKLVERFKIKIH